MNALVGKGLGRRVLESTWPGGKENYSGERARATRAGARDAGGTATATTNIQQAGIPTAGTLPSWAGGRWRTGERTGEAGA